MKRTATSLARRTVVVPALTAAAIAAAYVGVLASPARADNWALLIGIDQYQDSDNIRALGGADNDALALAKTLKEVAGFPEDHIRVLTSSGEKKPFKNAILLELARLKQRTQAGDILFIAYSGHGIESDGVPYLLPYDAVTATPDLIRDSSIAEDKFRDYLKSVPAKAVVVVLDMCRVDVDKNGKAGVVGDNRLTKAQVRGMDFGLATLKPGASLAHPQIVATFFACSPESRSYEWQEKRRGYFSYFLEQGLRGAAADRATHAVTIDSLKRYLASAVPSAVRKQELGKEQVPTAIVDGPLAADDFALARVLPSTVAPIASANLASTALAKEFLAYQDQLKRGPSEPFYRTYAPVRYSEWLQAAEAGDATAQLFVGYCCANGIAVAQDRALAIKWFTRSADKGNTFAMSNLGYLLDSGPGEVSDKDGALRWYRKAAELGNGLAMADLGWCLSDAKEYPEALRWLQKSADAGYSIGMRGMGNLYRNGLGVAKDPAQARVWYRKAAEAGDSYSRGWLVVDRIAPAFKAYADAKASPTAKSAALATVRSALPEFKSMDLESVDTVLESYGVRSAVDTLEGGGTTDPLLALHAEMIDRYTHVYQQASLIARRNYINSYAALTESLVATWFEDKKYDKVADFWKNSYEGLPIVEFTDGEQDCFVRQLSPCICSLLKVDDRENGKRLLDQTLALCDAILSKKPWDWYVRNAYEGLCFDAAAAFSEFGDTDEVQALLRRAWREIYWQYGKADNLDRYTTLPLRGEVPAGASEEDVAFFKTFGPRGKPGIKNDRYSMKRFTLPIEVDGERSQFSVYILSGPNGYAQLEDQFRWVKEYQGGAVPQSVRDSFRQLHKVALEKNVDFCALCVSDLGKKEGGR